MNSTDKRRIAAVESLTRVRAAESREPDGRRVVWHQGARGADLLSTVDTQGRVVTQELTLFDDHFRWSPEGLRTGRIAETGSCAAMKASALVSFDSALDRDRVLIAAAALSKYRGHDKYLLHFKHVIESAARGSFEDELSEVTDPGGGPAPAAAHPQACAPSSPPRPRWVVAVGVAGLVAAAAALVALLIR